METVKVQFEFLCNVAHLRAEVLGAKIPAHGECEFCAGGSEHAALLESAGRIASKEINVEAWVGRQNFFEILVTKTTQEAAEIAPAINRAAKIGG